MRVGTVVARTVTRIQCRPVSARESAVGDRPKDAQRCGYPASSRRGKDLTGY